MIESTLPTMPPMHTWPTMRRPTLAGIPHQASGQPARISPWLFAVPVVVFILRFLPTPLSDAAYGITTLYALTGRRQAVVSLLMLCLLNMATHSFGMPPGLAAMYRHPVVLSAAFSTLVLHGGGVFRTRSPRLLAGTSIVCLLLLMHSMFVSQIPALSVLKTLSFMFAILALIAGWGGLTAEDRRACETQVWGIVVGLMVLSVPMLFTPLGYLKRVGGFQGLTSQAQTFGPMMAILATYLWMSIITRRRLSLVLLSLAVLATAFVYLSRARIGGVTLAAGLLAGIGIAPAFAAFDRWQRQPRVRIGRLALAGVLIAIAFLFAGDVISQKVRDYLVKYGSAHEGTNFQETLYVARGGVVETMLDNIRQHPWTGIGFGVPTKGADSTTIVYDPFFNLPIMAAIEKGVMPVAIVEELGYFFAAVVYAWLLALGIAAARGGPIALALLVAAIAVNIAENCFFSPGGMGLYVLTFVAMAVTASPYNTPLVGPTRAAESMTIPAVLSGPWSNHAASGAGGHLPLHLFSRT